MAKRLKALAEAAGKDNQLAVAVRESAQQIWLAGLGAFSKAQEEGQKVFQALVREGTSIQKRTLKATEDKIGEVSSHVSQVAGGLTKQVNGGWDRLEGVFEERVARALKRLGVPTNREVQALTRRVEALTTAVEGMSATRARKTTPRRPRKTAAVAA
jgi:poly(hydroxyalkanoate) granule-associated protein